MNAVTHFTVWLMQRYLPDAFILAVLLTVVIMLMGTTLGGHTPFEMVDYWGKGFSALFKFAMQMTLVLVTGYALALTPPVRKLLDRLTDIPKTPPQALAMTALISFFGCYLNWGFGLVIGAILAREMGRKVQGLHFPLVVAAAYSAEIVRGPSSSIPLVVATPGHFMEQLTGIIPVTETLYSGWNLLLTGLILAALIGLYLSIRPKPESVISYEGHAESPNRAAAALQEPETFSEKIEHSRVMNYVLAVMPALYLAGYFMKKGFDLNLDVVILIFLLLSLLLHKHPMALLDAVKEAVVSSRGIILQFPLYAGIAGMMTESGLVMVVADWFIEIATPETFPVLTFLSAGLVNIFIPSGGGQWAIQGPVIIEAAKSLHADIPQTVMAFAWGDAWTNQIQPFWALPLLGVAGLSAKHIMGYCVVWLMLSGMVIGGVFLVLTFI
ncbi:TIGR00366 family protein [Uruburuella testudinis]|uniref:TIGR00366 family protein n=1 Tax=Uruburuella testudinis TaxID=1282863 RepID=A0ABY4DQB5_9NEIS|nr:TIGR00366 family protein [Uruburuella testudinis]UOO80924.1 TIGR00366 family protein [Uruburuella testudinis]